MHMGNYNWEKLYEELLDSGLSKAAFARTKRINEKNLYGRFRNIEKRNKPADVFKEVTLVSEVQSEVIIFSGNVRIEIKTPLNEQDFMIILKAVKSC